MIQSYSKCKVTANGWDKEQISFVFISECGKTSPEHWFCAWKDSISVTDAYFTPPESFAMRFLPPWFSSFVQYVFLTAGFRLDIRHFQFVTVFTHFCLLKSQYFIFGPNADCHISRFFKQSYFHLGKCWKWRFMLKNRSCWLSAAYETKSYFTRIFTA